MINGFCMMPPYPGDDLRDKNHKTEGAAMRAAAVAKKGILQTAGLNHPAPFDMKGYLRRPRLGEAATAPEAPASFNVLAVLVDFPDKEHVEDAAYFDGLMFNGEPGVPVSVRKYYRGQSGGRLDLIAPTLPSDIAWVRMDKPYSYYVNNNYGFGSFPQNSQGLITDLVAKLVALGIDFTWYDNNGDGFVDGLIVFHAGTGAELSGNPYDMWSHKWAVRPIDVGTVKISDYSVQPEYWFWPGNRMTLGVVSHETGHLLGLSDLYDVDGGSRGIYACLMASGSWLGGLGAHPCGLCAPMKIQAGFVDPIIARGTQTLLLRKGDIVQIPVALGDPALYYTVEHRPNGSLGGQDFYLPNVGGAVQVMRVDRHKVGNSQEWTPGSDPLRHYQVAQIQPDGRWDLENNGPQSGQGDWYPWQDVVRFGPDTEPSSNWYDGSKTGVVVEIISGGLQTNETAEVRIVAEEQVKGDLNGDGVVDMADLNIMIDILFYAGEQIPEADVNGDGVIDALDMNAIIDIIIGGGAATQAEVTQGMRERFA